MVDLKIWYCDLSIFWIITSYILKPYSYSILGKVIRFYYPSPMECHGTKLWHCPFLRSFAPPCESPSVRHDFVLVKIRFRIYVSKLGGCVHSGTLLVWLTFGIAHPNTPPCILVTIRHENYRFHTFWTSARPHVSSMHVETEHEPMQIVHVACDQTEASNATANRYACMRAHTGRF